MHDDDRVDKCITVEYDQIVGDLHFVLPNIGVEGENCRPGCLQQNNFLPPPSPSQIEATFIQENLAKNMGIISAVITLI